MEGKCEKKTWFPESRAEGRVHLRDIVLQWINTVTIRLGGVVDRRLGEIALSGTKVWRVNGPQRCCGLFCKLL